MLNHFDIFEDIFPSKVQRHQLVPLFLQERLRSINAFAKIVPSAARWHWLQWHPPMLAHHQVAIPEVKGRVKLSELSNLRAHDAWLYIYIYIWNPQQPFINGCFNWMIVSIFT